LYIRPHLEFSDVAARQLRANLPWPTAVNVLFCLQEWIFNWVLPARGSRLTGRFMPENTSNQFEFYGRHLLLNFRGCRIDLNDVERIQRDMTEAVTEVGATVLSCISHKFTPQGVSLVLLLSESHASIHTYPEEKACFIDLFTCGRRIRVEPFGEIMAAKWQPESVSSEMRERADPVAEPAAALEASA